MLRMHTTHKKKPVRTANSKFLIVNIQYIYLGPSQIQYLKSDISISFQEKDLNLLRVYK
jgi:hypothetical protein